jgi:hypothetical protein
MAKRKPARIDYRRMYKETGSYDAEQCLSMTPDERVVAVGELSARWLKARGIDHIPRFRRVARVVRAPWVKGPTTRRKRNRRGSSH